MHKLVKKEQCPLCASEGKDQHKDNLVVYDDGMKYCFARHKIVEAPIKTSINRMWKSYNTSEFSSGEYERVGDYNKKNSPVGIVAEDHFVNWAPSKVKLPNTVTKELPKAALLWLAKYGLGMEEAEKHGIVYSVENERLIFPIQIEDNLKAWQGRYLGTDRNRPKWWTEGNCSSFSYILHPEKKPDKDTPKFIIAVEDIASAIKVSKQFDCVPLLGSIFPKARMMGLAKEYNHLILWLDSDMVRKMNEYRSTAVQFFDTVQLIATAKDPKEIPYEEIKDKVENRIVRMKTA